MHKPRVQIVNESDQLIGHKLRADIDYTHDIYRTASLWLENGDGGILIAQRKVVKDKHKDPGLWGPAVSGTLEEDETYESNIIKEAAEEIGLTNISPIFVTTFLQLTPRRQFASIFVYTTDLPLSAFVIQEDEVEQIQWIAKASLLQDFQDNPTAYVPSMSKFIEYFIDAR